MLVKVIFKLFKALPLGLRSRIYLTYDNRVLMDGLGSQLQRIIGVYQLSRKLGVRYQHSGFEDIMIVSPVDVYQTEEDVSHYIEYANSVIDCFPSQDLADESKDIIEKQFQRINLRAVLGILWLSIKNTYFGERNSIRCKIAFPFPLIDHFPLHQPDISCLADRLSATYNLDKKSNLTVIHFRSGFGVPVIFPGERKPRHKSLKDFFDAISNAEEYLKLSTFELNPIVVLTDAPSEDVVFVAPTSQLDRWVGTPLESGTTTFLGVTDEQFQSYTNRPVEIIRGGDPLYAIALMSIASLLVISKSSFGYVGALLNSSGTIAVPRDFWQKRQKGWVSF